MLKKFKSLIIDLSKRVDFFRHELTRKYVVTYLIQPFALNKKRRNLVMNQKLWSKTTTGKWAVMLTLLFVGLMFIKITALGISVRLPFPSPFIAVFGVIGFIMGLIAIIKDKDRSIMVILTIPIGLLIIFWILAELAYPH